MNAVPKVTAEIMGATVFNAKQATLEWTPEGRLRVTRVEPGEAPVIVLDAAPQELKVTSYPGQGMLTIATAQGAKIRLSLQQSMLAPEPGETAHDYGLRQASLGVPTLDWWTQTLQAAGATTSRFGVGKTFAIGGAIAVGILVVIVVIVLVTEGF